MTAEVYSLATDFGGTISIRRLTGEILASGIATPHTGVTRNGDAILIEFRGTITAPERVTLDAVVAAHTIETADEAKDRRFDAELAQIDFFGLFVEVAFDQENRIRALEGLPALSRGDFLDALRVVFRGI